MKIIISGRAAALDSATKQEIAALDTLKNLDGVVCEGQSCCEYLDTELDNIGLIGGLLRLSWDAEAKQLRVVTEYQSPRMLKPGELKALVKETTGQWSDGIGENYFWADVRPGITLDLSPADQRKDLHFEQIDDGVKVPAKKFSPLLKAAEKGDIDKIKELLAKGEDINTQDKHGRPVLHLAIRGEHHEAVQFLIEQGADVNIKGKGWPMDTTDVTPLHLLLSMSVPVVHSLLQKGAQANATDSAGETPLFQAAHGGAGWLEHAGILIENGGDVNCRNTQDGGTPLLHSQDPAMIKFLLDHGADPNVRDDHGKTCYDFAKWQAGPERTDANKRWMPAAELHLATIRSRAEQGDAASQHTLAEYHDRGVGMPQNPEEAFRGYERAAQSGYRLSVVRLGLCYQNGRGTAADVGEALACFRQAAEAGVPLAMGILGQCYAEGKGVAQDQAEALKWYRRGAEIDPTTQVPPNEVFDVRKGVGACRAELGACFDEGKGVTKDPHEALKCYEAALEGGFYEVKPAIEKLQEAMK